MKEAGLRSPTSFPSIRAGENVGKNGWPARSPSARLRTSRRTPKRDGLKPAPTKNRQKRRTGKSACATKEKPARSVSARLRTSWRYEKDAGLKHGDRRMAAGVRRGEALRVSG